jgi:hypothetical protein
VSERLRKRVVLENTSANPHEAVGFVRYLMGDGNYLTG